METPDGKATLKEIYVTELGYIMAKVYHRKRKVFINYRIGSIKSLLDLNNLNLLSEWTENIKLKVD